MIDLNALRDVSPVWLGLDESGFFDIALVDDARFFILYLKVTAFSDTDAMDGGVFTVNYLNRSPSSVCELISSPAATNSSPGELRRVKSIDFVTG